MHCLAMNTIPVLVAEKPKRVPVTRAALPLCMILALAVTASAAIKELAADTLIAWMAGKAPSDFILIDVRDPSELASTAVIGNENCRPYNFSLNLGAFDSIIGQLPQTALIVLYCRSSNRSDQAAQKLADKGFTSAYSLVVGFSTWKGSTLPASMVKPRADLPAPSMVIASATVAVRLPCIQTPIIHAAKGGLAVANLVAPHHVLSLFDAQGRCVNVVLDPFMRSTRYTTPNTVATGEYVACLDIVGQGPTIFIMNTF
jgi:rhodanese-related sulfurtransferase